MTTAADFVPFDITELLDRAAARRQADLPRFAGVAGALPAVLMVGMPVGLRLVIDNAIANAVRHGGATQVRLAVSTSAGEVQVTVDDNGRGVPEAERPGVRTVLPWVDGLPPGSGLGPALVAQQAELHSGTASADTSPLGGASAASPAGRHPA